MGICIKGSVEATAQFSEWSDCFVGVQQENVEPYPYTEEGLKQELENRLALCDVVNDKLFWETKCDNTVMRWGASPVFMAICIGAYDLARQLIEKGYPTVVVDDNGKIEELKGSVQSRYGDVRKISLGQFLLGAPDMPDEFRIYLWRCIAKEKRAWSKQLRKPRGKVIDFSMVLQERYENTMDVITRTSDFVMGHFSKQTLKSLIYIADKYPKYLKNAVDEDWEHVLADNVFNEVEELVKILLDKVITRDVVRLRLLKVLSKSEMEVSNDIFQDVMGFEDRVIHMFKTLFPHFKTTNEGKRLLRIFMIRWFRETYLNIKRDVNCMFEKENELFFFKMFKSIEPVDYTLKQCAEEYKMSDSLMNNSDIMESMNESLFGYQDIILLFALYKDRLGYQTCLGDDSDYYVKEFLARGKEMNKNNMLKSVERRAVMEWLSNVDAFHFKNQKQLAMVQVFILQTQNYDFVLKMLQKGFLGGRQVQCALEYCMRKQELQKLVPCILSYEGGTA